MDFVALSTGVGISDELVRCWIVLLLVSAQKGFVILDPSHMVALPIATGHHILESGSVLGILVLLANLIYKVFVKSSLVNF